MINRRQFVKGAALAATPLLPSTVFAQGNSSAHKPSFKYYDELLYVGKPDLHSYGLSKIHAAYTWQLWGEGKFGYNKNSSELPIEALLSYPKRYKLETNPPNMIIMDIEHWKHYGDISTKELQLNIEKYITCIEALRSVFPSTTKISLYNIGPQPNHGYLTQRELRPSEMKRWMMSNDLVQEVVDHMDFVTPSCYFGKNYTYEMWERKARYFIEEAKRLGKGKPVVPFIWPQYANLEPLTELPGPIWGKQLDYMAEAADSLVLWRRHKGPQASKWDDNAPWWLETKKHLAKKQLA